MIEPKFKNRPNDRVMYEFESEATGVKIKQEYWVSRSVAVDAFIFGVKDGVLHILTIKRSQYMMDEPNKYAVPSGYHDWNESGYDAMVREVYEETGLYIYDVGKYHIFSNTKQPFNVITDPESNKRQNVCLYYIGVFDFPHFKFPDIESFVSKETALVKWMTMDEFLKQNYEWAFNHDKRIKEALVFLRANHIDV
jgi:ADP-ribose pyrophosphatase YjhB (NUDIX family)